MLFAPVTQVVSGKGGILSPNVFGSEVIILDHTSLELGEQIYLKSHLVGKAFMCSS